MIAAFTCASFFLIMGVCVCFACWKICSNHSPSARLFRRRARQGEPRHSRNGPTSGRIQPYFCDTSINIVNITTNDGSENMFQEHNFRGRRYFIELPTYDGGCDAEAGSQTPDADHLRLSETRSQGLRTAVTNNRVDRPEGNCSSETEEPPKYSPPPLYDILATIAEAAEESNNATHSPSLRDADLHNALREPSLHTPIPPRDSNDRTEAGDSAKSTDSDEENLLEIQPLVFDTFLLTNRVPSLESINVEAPKIDEASNSPKIEE